MSVQFGPRGGFYGGGGFLLPALTLGVLGVGLAEESRQQPSVIVINTPTPAPAPAPTPTPATQAPVVAPVASKNLKQVS